MKKQAYILGASLLVMSGVTFATTISASAQIFDVSARQFFKDKDGKINSQYRFDFTTVDAKTAKDIQAPPLPGYHLKPGSKMLVAGSDAVIFDYEKDEDVPTPTPTTNPVTPTENPKQTDESKTNPAGKEQVHEEEHQAKDTDETKVETTNDEKLESKTDKAEEKQDKPNEATKANLKDETKIDKTEEEQRANLPKKDEVIVKSNETKQSKEDDFQEKKSDKVNPEIVDKTESKNDKVQEQLENLKSDNDSSMKETKSEKTSEKELAAVIKIPSKPIEQLEIKSPLQSKKQLNPDLVDQQPIKQIPAADKNSESTLTKQRDALIYTNNDELPTFKASNLSAEKATKAVPHQSINDSKSLKNYVKDAPAVTEIKAANTNDLLKEHGETIPSVTLQSAKGKTVKVKNKKLKDVNGTQTKTAKGRLPALGEDNHASKMMLLVLGILSLIVILFNKVRTKNKD